MRVVTGVNKGVKEYVPAEAPNPDLAVAFVHFAEQVQRAAQPFSYLVAFGGEQPLWAPGEVFLKLDASDGTDTGGRPCLGVIYNHAGKNFHPGTSYRGPLSKPYKFSFFTLCELFPNGEFKFDYAVNGTIPQWAKAGDLMSGKLTSKFKENLKATLITSEQASRIDRMRKSQWR